MTAHPAPPPKAEATPAPAPAPRRPSLRRRLRRRLWPRTLRGRAFLLMALPVVLAQIGFVGLLYDRLYSELTDRAADILASEILFALGSLDRARSESERREALAMANSTLHLELRLPATDGTDTDGTAASPAPQPGASTSEAPPPARTTFRARLPVSRSLHERLAQGLGLAVQDLAIQRSPDNKRLTLLFTHGGHGGAPVQVSVQRSRLLSSSWHVVAAWATLLPLLLLVAAAVFLRNQLSSLKRLARAAERLGRNLPVEDFQPVGAFEVRRTARAFLRMRARLRWQEQKRREFLAGIGHDLRTPLARMRLRLQLLEESDSELAEITGLEREAEAMDRIVSDYLRFIRDEGDEAPEHLELKNLLGPLTHRLAVERPEISLSLSCEPGLAGELSLSATQRCLENLISNAIHHADSRVRILARRRTSGRGSGEGEMMEILIEDDGPGIPEDQRAAALRPFSRATNAAPQKAADAAPQESETGSESKSEAEAAGTDISTSRTPWTGLGLGLAIAQDRALQQGGTLTLQDSDLGGLRAVLLLPAV